MIQTHQHLGSCINQSIKLCIYHVTFSRQQQYNLSQCICFPVLQVFKKMNK